MDLTALWTIPFLHGNGLACRWASLCWQRNGIACMDSLLAYGHRGRPMVIGARPVGEPKLTENRHRDEQWQMMPPLQVLMVSAMLKYNKKISYS